MIALMKKNTKTVFVAMSGGVDSSVAAALLVQEGYRVVGAFMRNWTKPVAGVVTNQWQRDEADARLVAEKLGIPFYAFDFEEEYRREVAGYMLREYAAGRTPNPDVMCNKAIKFGSFLEKARGLGADAIATGHYVRMQKSKIPPSPRLRRAGKNQNDEANYKIIRRLACARDLNKDQGYFLWTLTQEQLRHCLFPIGDYTKPEVRELARQFSLPTAEKPDSQGICFVGEVPVRDFLKEYLPVEHGSVFTAAGKRVGEHEGAALYTIGQRRGVGSVGGGTPYYVIGKDIAGNALIVAEGQDDPALYGSELTAEEVSWVSGRPPRLPLACKARIRYRQPLQACRLGKSKIQNPKFYSERSRGTETIKVAFQTPQRAITPGQSVVFYRGDPLDPARGREMLGGGVICEVGRHVVRR